VKIPGKLKSRTKRKINEAFQVKQKVRKLG
jgi:hypothetical protein